MTKEKWDRVKERFFEIKEKTKDFDYYAWSKANKELHKYYQENLISDEFKKKDAELTEKFNKIKEERRVLRYEETQKENLWVSEELKKIGL